MMRDDVNVHESTLPTFLHIHIYTHTHIHTTQRSMVGRVTDDHHGARVLSHITGTSSTSKQQKRFRKLLARASQLRAKYELNDVTHVRRMYSQKKYRHRHLYDVVFPSQHQLSSPDLIWDHAVGDPNSITAGRPGVHFYLAAGASPGERATLMGVVERRDRARTRGGRRHRRHRRHRPARSARRQRRHSPAYDM